MILNALREGLGRVIVFADWATRPKPLSRSLQAQAEVDAAARGLVLYQFYACPFCVKTRRVLHRLKVPVEIRDAQKDPQHRAALETGGGKVQVPCLRIDEGGETRWVYESNTIRAYLEQRFGASQSPQA
jgi:glutaredoxin